MPQQQFPPQGTPPPSFSLPVMPPGTKPRPRRPGGNTPGMGRGPSPTPGLDPSGPGSVAKPLSNTGNVPPMPQMGGGMNPYQGAPMTVPPQILQQMLSSLRLRQMLGSLGGQQAAPQQQSLNPYAG